MDKSTERPWRAEYSGFLQFEDIFSGDLRVCRVRGNNARRIVASVNACSAIPIEALEGGVVGEMVEALKKTLTLLPDGSTKDKAESILSKLEPNP